MSSDSFKIFHYTTAVSTMDDAAERLKLAIQQSNFENFVVIADQQTGGRGRLYRTWISPPGNFYATYVIPSPDKAIASGLYAIVSAIAVAQSFESIGIAVKLKWPNDIFINNCKLGGILIQLTEPNYVMIGVGINLASYPQNQVLKPATSVMQATQKTILPLAYHALLSTQLTKIFDLLKCYETEEITLRWQKYCLHHQQMVSIQNNYFSNDTIERYTGWYDGIDQSGALILKDLQTGERRLVYVGDAL